MPGKQSITDINVIAELERCGIPFEFKGDDEVVVRCPFHDDAHPSCYINVEKRLFRCRAAGCGRDGDFVAYLCGALKCNRAVMLLELSKRYALEDDKIIAAQVVEGYHKNIWKAGPLLKELRKRGVTDELIRQHRLGEKDGRVVIPIKNQQGLFVNLRLYLPGAVGKDKFRNTRRHSRERWFPAEQLEYKSLLVCGGEVKAIVAAAQLNGRGVGAISTTSGEDNLSPENATALSGKRVWVCGDIDPEGRRAAYDRCAVLSRHTPWVGDVLLPLDIDKYPHGDINDFVAQEGGDLFPLLEACAQWEPRSLFNKWDSALDPVELELSRAMHAGSVGQRVLVTGVVNAVADAAYSIPQSVVPRCDRSQPVCAECPVFGANDGAQFDVPSESPAILEMVGSTKSAQREALMSGLDVPPSCKSVAFDVVSYYHVDETRVSPQISITDVTTERSMHRCVCIGEGLELNETYKLTGRMHPHPKTQENTLLVSNYVQTRDALASYEPDKLDHLVIFRPRAWTLESLTVKLNEIYSDIEANVTRVYLRRDMHLMVDLAYHSVLLIDDNKRGWVETLIVGDTAQGKSELVRRLMPHYRLGEKVECKNASMAGLLGGLEQVGSNGRWFVMWGCIPMNDRRLLVLEELKGAKVNEIASLTDMRSSGIAELQKIEKRRTHARTRIVALSNTRSGQVKDHKNGLNILRELIGDPEDIRRFDVSLIVAKEDISIDEFTAVKLKPPVVKHLHTSELCHDLILWGWTRGPDQVIFDGLHELISSSVDVLCKTFTDDLPVLDRGSAEDKIKRLSASLAVRTFSSSSDMHSVVVRPCHVEYVVGTLKRIYSSRVFGLDAHSKVAREVGALKNVPAITNQLQRLPRPRVFVTGLLQCADEFDSEWVEVATGLPQNLASEFLSTLFSGNAVTRVKRGWSCTPAFIDLLKRLYADPSFVETERPDFMKEEF